MIIKSFNQNKRKVSPLDITLIIGFILLGGFLVLFGNGGITGYVVNEVSEEVHLKDVEIFVDKPFDIIEIGKDVNSMLNLYVESEFNSNIFVETNDCGYWKAGKDRDNIILYSINGIKGGDFNVGDPSLNTIQQMELYKTNYLCLIVVNREYQQGNHGNFKVKVDQLDKDKWTII